MRKFAFGFIALAAIGCGEDQNASGIFPAEGFLGRTMRVQISGDNTEWNDGVTVDFGPGITVKDVSAASPTTLFAEIEITAEALPGLRDVVINDGQNLALHNAFSLASPIKVELSGTIAQGSLASFSVRNLDLENPFDDTCTASSLFGCDEYGNVAIESPPGTYAQIDSVSPFALSGTLLLDADATPGAFAVMSGAGDTVITSPLGTSVDVAARAPTPLSGMAIATIMEPYASHFYEITTAADTLQRLSATAEADPPAIYVLGESGKFADFLGGGARPAILNPTAGKLTAVVVDGSGMAGYAYTLRHQPLTLAKVAEVATNNNTLANAQTVNAGMAALVTGAKITADTDVDWYKFTVPAGSAMKKVRVMTTGGSDPQTDTAVEIHSDTMGTVIGGGDKGYGENITSEMPVGAAATIYVKIFTDPEYYDTAHQDYIATIWLE
jgi:hypothetical protein